MQEEIKYMAWHIEEKKLCEVANINLEMKNAFLKGVKPHPEFEKYDVKGRACDFHEIILLPYIGIKDENGKEIYRGDVIRYVTTHGTISKPIIGVVVLSTFGYDHGVERKDSGEKYHTDYLAFVHCQEKIGNIYENPELL